MDIDSWLKNKGSYADGLALYALLPGCNKTLLAKLGVESPQNLITLKYELRMAKGTKLNVVLPVKENKLPVAVKPKLAAPISAKVIEQAAAAEFGKETMATYPPELHPVYRQRIENFYMACELKFKLNALEPDQEEEALALILEIDSLWHKIDKAWDILTHWKEYRRIMPVAASQDFSAMSALQLHTLYGNMKSAKTKRSATLVKLEQYVAQNPEDRTKLNLLNRKKEQFQQLLNDLEEVKMIINKG